MPDWRIYYDDESTYDSDDGPPESAPPYGVLAIVFADRDHGRMVMNGWDWYFYHGTEENWWGADIHGLLDQLLHNLPVRALKQGRNAPAKVWKETLQRAMVDPDFPLKSATSKRERPFQVT
jgi:hypothetical protein